MSAAATEQQQARAGLVSALEDGVYSSRLSARSALYTDLTLLLHAMEKAGGDPDPRVLIVDENCLAKASDALRRKAWKELKIRYILSHDHPLFTAFLAEWRRCASDPEHALTAYCLLALNDKLVADLALNYLFPRLRRAPAEVRADDVLAFLTAASHGHPEVKGWSASTARALAQKYTASIRDFGLARGTQNKVTIRPALYGAPVRMLVHALRLVGTRDLDIMSAPIFKLLAIDVDEVVDALGELNRQGSLRFRIQGDIVVLDTHEEA